MRIFAPADALYADANRSFRTGLAGVLVAAVGITIGVALSSHEQSAAIEQVNRAVAQLDQTTQQNAALFEQSAATAESLQGQVRRLADAVAVSRLGAAAA